MSSTATKTEFSNVSAGKAQFQVFDFSKEESEVAANRKTEMLRQADGPKESSNQASIPSELRGYVSVAVSTGLLKGDSTFRPQDALTRGDLAHAIAVTANAGNTVDVTEQEFPGELVLHRQLRN